MCTCVCVCVCVCVFVCKHACVRTGLVNTPHTHSLDWAHAVTACTSHIPLRNLLLFPLLQALAHTLRMSGAPCRTNAGRTPWGTPPPPHHHCPHRRPRPLRPRCPPAHTAMESNQSISQLSKCVKSVSCVTAFYHALVGKHNLMQVPAQSKNGEGAALLSRLLLKQKY